MWKLVLVDWHLRSNSSKMIEKYIHFGPYVYFAGLFTMSSIVYFSGSNKGYLDDSHI